MLDKSVESIVDRAIEGESPCRDEMLMLMGIDVESAEAAYVRWGAEVLGRRASGGVGQIYAQIGRNASNFRDLLLARRAQQLKQGASRGSR